MANKQPLKVHEIISVFNTNIYAPIMRHGKFRKKGGGKNSLIFGNTQGKCNDEYYPISIIDLANCSDRQGRLHPTQKPVALFEYLIRTYTNEGETVLDNCAGSGTTAIACLNTNRKYILIEKEKEYIDIINKRISEHEIQVSIC